MGESAIPDTTLIAVLRPFVRATGPVLDGLREADPFGLRHRVAQPDDPDRGHIERILDALAAVEVPGTAAWAAMDVDARSRWWVHRVGRFTTLVAAVPGVGGALASRLPISAALGAVGQGLVLVAIAGEHGVHDEERLIELLGSVLFLRTLLVDPPDAAADAAANTEATEILGGLAAKPTASAPPSNLAASARASENGPADSMGTPSASAPDPASDPVGLMPGAVSDPPTSRPGTTSGPAVMTPASDVSVLRRVAGVVWRLGRGLLAVEGELDKRPHGNLITGGLSLLPVVGAVGKYLGEWSGLKQAAAEGERWLRRPRGILAEHQPGAPT